MIRARVLSIIVLGAVAVIGAGCGASVDPVESAEAEAAATKAPVAVGARAPVKLFGEAFADVALRPEQRAEIEKLAADATARHAPVEATKRELVEAVAAQVESGRIDRAALAPKIDALARAWKAAQAGDRPAIQRVHALLDGDQRDALVDAIEDRVRAKLHDRPMRQRMKEWVTDLELSDEQVDRIKDAMKARWRDADRDGGRASFRKHMEHGKEALEAFRADDFDVNDKVPVVDPAKGDARVDRVLGVIETALPILTPRQRVLAAKKIRERVAALDD